MELRHEQSYGTSGENGAFTWCLLAGLNDKLADLDGDGIIHVSELQQYLANVVPQVTNNRQRPATREEHISNDWRVW